jgi:hypothetical protein
MFTSNKMMKNLLVAGACFLGSLSFAQAQRQCGTPDVETMLSVSPKELREKFHKIEDHTENFVRNFKADKVTGVITIPVVVHVVYNTAAQNISDAIIQSQINVLNADFRRTNADKTNTPAAFAGVAADFEIQFQLATRDPQGNATTGITRTQTTKTFFEYGGGDPNGVFVKQSAQGGKDAWNPSSYLNMWVCNFGGSSSSLLGYATFPTDAGTFKDGVVMGYKYFGVNPSLGGVFGYGRTATHEVGHWLNLRHIWGDANCGNDLVSDTPTQQTSNGGCPTFPKRTCGNTTNGDMFMNYMDYTNDQCMNVFTVGQKARARALFDAGGARISLLSSNGLGGGTTPTCPTSLTTPSASSSAVASTSATISWAAVTGATSYNVNYKTAAATTWTNVTSTSTSASITGLTASTAYNFRVQAVCSATLSAFSTTGNFTTTAATIAYCASKGNSVADEWIASVRLARGATTIFTNTSGKNAGYGNFTGTSYTVGRGNALTITITPAWTATKYNEGYSVWVDYNRDGDFADAGEQVTTQAITQTTPITKTFTIPATAALGTTRMRVSMKYNGVPTSCETFGYGEVEDYTLNVVTSAREAMAQEAPSTGLTLFPNPANDKVSVRFDNTVENNKGVITILNAQGQVVKTQAFEASEIGMIEQIINLDGVKKGLYIVNVTAEGFKQVRKLAVSK